MANTKKRAKTATKARPQTQPQAAQTSKRSPLKIAAWVVGGLVVIGFVVWISIPPEQIPEGAPEGVVEVALEDPLHVDGEIPYEQTVPAGGPHNPAWLNCGVYREPVREENAVHALEHAAVWITYNDSVSQTQIDTLEGFGRDRSKVIVSPVPDQADLIMATAWGWQLPLTDADDIRLRQFLNEFEGSLNAPEPAAGCSGGVGTPDA